MSLIDKADLFFHDYSLAPLFVQENYIHVKPAAAGWVNGASIVGAWMKLYGNQMEYVGNNMARWSSPRGNMEKHLVLLSKAADSICDGDLVDRQIRSKQNWSLLPTQVNSTFHFHCLIPAFHSICCFVVTGCECRTGQCLIEVTCKAIFCTHPTSKQYDRFWPVV